MGRFNEREYEVITEVHNAGTAPAGISGGDNTYEIFLKDGSSLKSGPFVYAFPPVLEPGEYGYYMEGGELGLSLDVTTVAKVVPHVQYDTTSCDPGAFTVTDVRTYKVLYGSGLSAEGLVTNVGATAAPNLIVGYVFFGAHGNILGGLYDNLAGSLSPGDSVQDMTVFPGTPPILSTKVASTKTFAFDESLLGC